MEVIRFHGFRCLLVLAAAGCAPVRENHRMVSPPAALPKPEVVPSKPARIPAPVETSAVLAPAPRHTSATVGGISMELVVFDSRSHRLEVADQPAGPGSKWPDSQAAGAAWGGLAAINAGFFTPEGRPLGMVVSQGAAGGSWNGASSLGSAVWFEEKSGRSGIARREAIGSGAARGMNGLIQAGPMLVEHGSAVGGLDGSKSSPRTFLLWDGGTRWAIAHADACTLAQLAAALPGNSPGWPVVCAMNLDGGRSAELWISGQVAGGGAFIRPFWNKPVRNFLILKPRS